MNYYLQRRTRQTTQVCRAKKRKRTQLAYKFRNIITLINSLWNKTLIAWLIIANFMAKAFFVSLFLFAGKRAITPTTTWALLSFHHSSPKCSCVYLLTKNFQRQHTKSKSRAPHAFKVLFDSREEKSKVQVSGIGVCDISSRGASLHSSASLLSFDSRLTTITRPVCIATIYQRHFRIYSLQQR